MLVHSAEPYNAAPPLASLRASPITPIPLFLVRNHGTVPVVDPAPYRLAVTGLVDRELRLSLESLRRGVFPPAVARHPPFPRGPPPGTAPPPAAPSRQAL